MPRLGLRVERLVALRDLMAQHGLDGLLVPKSDRFQSEYLRPSDERLAWLTGFTGSAAFCVVLKDEAAIFVDGRYREQVQQEVDANIFEPVWIEDTSVAKWLTVQLSEDGAVIGYDPWLHTSKGLAPITAAVHRAKAHLQKTSENLIDSLWADRPLAPLTRVWRQTGVEPASDKLGRMASQLQGGSDAFFLTRPDSISWLINGRSTDIACNPVVLSWALLHSDGRLDWIIAASRIGADILSGLEERVRLIDPSELDAYLKKATEQRTFRIGLDSTQAPVELESLIQEAGAEIIQQKDPCLMAKALKSEAEIAGIRAAHRRDARPLARCLAWIDASVTEAHDLDEWTVSTKLQDYRRMEAGYLQDSFPAIVGSGPNAAIVHYHAMPETCRRLEPEDILLIDSGAHYHDTEISGINSTAASLASGTTDVTRTLWLGQGGFPAEDVRSAATAVLKGHIALATCRFPQGVTGAQLDTLARAPLWAEGLDFDHGTGHGVGHLLCVHESPPSISKRAHDIVLKPGMVLSNEPGYYRPKRFGIRLESLLLVQEDGKSERGTMLSFETLTYIPFDLRLFDLESLSHKEQDWLFAYQLKAIEICAERLDESDRITREWLMKMRPPGSRV